MAEEPRVAPATRLARVEAIQQEVLRRVGVLESRQLSSITGAVQDVRTITEDMLKDRLSLTEKQIDDLKKIQTRMMWLIFIGLAGQVMKMLGPSALSDLLSKLG